MKLSDRNWKPFYIGELDFQIINSKAYHKTNLTINTKGIPYISRTNLNNGLDSIVLFNEEDIKNPKNTIVFGAENAKFFYQPFKYITGNKMYYIKNNNFNKYIGLFLVSCLDKSIQKCGFGYGQGLTGTRFKNRSIYLPINEAGNPDYEFMEAYMRYLEQKKLKTYLDYLNK